MPWYKIENTVQAPISQKICFEFGVSFQLTRFDYCQFKKMLKVTKKKKQQPPCSSANKRSGQLAYISDEKHRMLNSHGTYNSRDMDHKNKAILSRH